MNYERIYNQIIERGKQRILEGYGENHHIIPKCMGGADTQDNMVRLTAKEHFLCHLLLIEMYPGIHKLVQAAYLMTHSRNKGKVSSKYYAILREGHGKASSQRNKGRKVTEAQKKQISKTLKGRVITWGDKISEAKKGKKKGPQSKETREKRSAALKNRTWEDIYGVEGARLRRESHKQRRLKNKNKSYGKEKDTSNLKRD